MPKEEEEEESCPLCCNAFSPADRLYPLHCRTVPCQFQYCLSCLQSFLAASQDAYGLSSDGSQQVKVSLRCPMCRAPYRTGTTISTPTSSTTNGIEIVRAIGQLRTAHCIAASFSCEDSECRASELAQRRLFLSSLRVSDLQAAVVLVQEYQDALPKHCGTVPPLDWDAWQRYLLRNHETNTASQALNHDSSDDSMGVLSRDPTLFLGGLDELLNADEQEYITRMLVSGVAETVAQAAYILHSMVEVATRSTSTLTTANSTTTNNNTSQRSRALANKKSMAQLEHEKKVRQRFPLPPFMPRVVALPPYNPLDTKNPKQLPLQFAVPSRGGTTQEEPPLLVARVVGPAGRVGLRRGDTVTHVNGDRVASFSEYTVAMQYALSSSSSEVLITVNANEAVAQQLRQRAQQMKQQNVRFHS